MFRLERFADRHGGAAVVTLQDGSLRDEAWLSAELAGVDRALFESLFAFGQWGARTSRVWTGSVSGSAFLRLAW